MKLYVSIFICFMACAFSIHAAETRDLDDYNHYLKSFAYNQTGEYRKALDELFAVAASSVNAGLEKDMILLLTKNDKMNEAEQHGIAFLQTHPDDYDVLLVMAYIEGTHMHFPQAIAYAAAAQQQKPEQLDAAHYLGTLYTLNQEWDKARDEFKKIYAKQKDSVPLLHKLAELSIKTEHTDQALAYYREIVAKDPTDATAWWNAGLILSTQKSPEARDWYLSALSHTQDTEQRLLILNKLGFDAYSANDTAAIIFFTQVLQATQGTEVTAFQKTQRYFAITLLAKYYQEHHEFEKAIALQIDMLKEKPDALWSVFSLASMYEQQGAYHKALQVLTTAFKQFPDAKGIGELSLCIGALYKKIHEPKKAIPYLTHAMAHEKTIPASLYLAMIYDEQGKTSQAIALCTSVLDAEPTNADAANYIAYRLAQDTTNYAHAEKLARIALQSYPDYYAYLDTLGFIAYKQKKYTEAEVLLSSALYRMPAAESYEHLGAVLAEQHKLDHAYKSFFSAHLLGTPHMLEKMNALALDPATTQLLRIQATLALFRAMLAHHPVTGTIRIVVRGAQKAKVRGTFTYTFPNELHIHMPKAYGDVVITSDGIVYKPLLGTAQSLDMPALSALLAHNHILFPHIREQQGTLDGNKLRYADTAVSITDHGYVQDVVYDDGMRVCYDDWKLYANTPTFFWPRVIKITIDSRTTIDICFENIGT